MSSFLKLGSIYHAIYGWAHLSGVVAAALALMRRMDELHLGFPSAGGSSLQRNDAGVWLCEYPGLSFQRSPVCACLLVSSLLLSGATMSQQSSLTQSAHSVRQAQQPQSKFRQFFRC